MENVIVIKQLKKSYPLPKGQTKDGLTTHQALKGISFEVKKGEIFGLLGPNGAGKTTTLEILEGLKEQSSGQANVLGFNNTTQSWEIKKRIGVQLQSSDYLPYLSLGELIDLFASLYGKAANRDWLLELVDLKDKEQDLVRNLSGGQKQRFTIATALVNDPEIIFLDEPTTGLDPAARRQLWQLVKKINNQGITIVLTTHYMEEAEFLCHRVAILDKGEILEIEEPKKLIENLSHTTQVSFLTEQPINPDLFKTLPEVEKGYSHYPKTILEITSLDHISQILETLKKNEINFSGFTVKTATLEDVYLDLTGKEFEE